MQEVVPNQKIAFNLGQTVVGVVVAQSHLLDSSTD